MGWRIKSLSEDDVDVYTHTWTVTFFLFISFLLLVIPPNLRHGTPMPEYVASCWFPSHYTQSQVDYTNSVCGEAFNAEKEGRKYQHAWIGQKRTYESPLSVPSSPNATVTEETMEVDLENQNIPMLPVAGILFLLAVCLRIPHMLWSILSGCTSCINIDQTLQAAKAGDFMGAESRQQLYIRLIKAFSDSIRGRPTMSTYLYIFMKFMVILVIVAEILIVTKYSHSQIRTQEAGNNTVEENVWHDTSFKVELKLNPDKHPVYQCGYIIRQGAHVRLPTVQCHYKRQQIASKLMNEPTLSERVLETTDSMLLNVHIMVVSVLAVLVVVNVFNTAFLLLNLCSTSSRMRVGLRRTSPLDLMFLIHMARTNLNVGVAASLVEMAASNPDIGHEKEGELRMVDAGAY